MAVFIARGEEISAAGINGLACFLVKRVNSAFPLLARSRKREKNGCLPQMYLPFN